MKFLRSLLLYTALGLGANTAFAMDTSQFDALKTGDMRNWRGPNPIQWSVPSPILTKQVRNRFIDLSWQNSGVEFLGHMVRPVSQRNAKPVRVTKRTWRRDI